MLQPAVINTILFVLFAYLMGFIAAIPIGASQLEITKRALNGYLASAIMIGAGTTISDAMYGAIAFFGIAPFLQEPLAVGIFRLINSVILTALGIWTIYGTQSSVKKNNSAKEILNNKKLSFITGLSLALTNPMIMIWWLIGFHFLVSIKLVEQNNTSQTIIFLIISVFGLLSYHVLLSYSIYKSKKFLSEKGLHKITLILGWVLIGLAVYFIYMAYDVFAGL